MTYEELQDKVSGILNKAETEMENLIEKFNENSIIDIFNCNLLKTTNSHQS